MYASLGRIYYTRYSILVFSSMFPVAVLEFNLTIGSLGFETNLVDSVGRASMYVYGTAFIRTKFHQFVRGSLGLRKLNRVIKP